MNLYDIGVPIHPLPKEVEQPGMTLRDYFAGQIVSAIDQRGNPSEEIARRAYRIADAMLVARLNPPRNKA